jgi:hypothetical protein
MYIMTAVLHHGALLWSLCPILELWHKGWDLYGGEYTDCQCLDVTLQILLPPSSVLKVFSLEDRGDMYLPASLYCVTTKNTILWIKLQFFMSNVHLYIYFVYCTACAKIYSTEMKRRRILPCQLWVCFSWKKLTYTLLAYWFTTVYVM